MRTMGRVIVGIAAAGVAGTVSHAAVLDFDQFSGSKGFDDHSVGSEWMFHDVMEGVDMKLALDDVTSNTKFQVKSNNGDFGVVVNGRRKHDPRAGFTATFLDSETGENVAVSFDFVVKDFDRTGAFVEQFFVDGLTSYSVADNSRMTGYRADGGLWAEAVSGNTNERDERNWLGGSFNDIESFSFSWGFTGLNNGNGKHNRGMFLGGKATISETFGGSAKTTAIPEPASAVLLAAGGVLMMRRPRRATS